MNSTPPSSRFERIAARSPARSSAGPLVGWIRAFISVAMMPASVVLPSPGGPASSTWSTAWPRLREARLQLDQQSLRRPLADAGDEHQRVEIIVGEAPAERARGMDRKDRERQLRPDTRRRDQRFEGVALVATRKPEQDHGVFAHVEMGEQERV